MASAKPIGRPAAARSDVMLAHSEAASVEGQSPSMEYREHFQDEFSLGRGFRTVLHPVRARQHLDDRQGGDE
jgi:hypothetical protein